jgi:dienelactone hydrolase
MSASVSASRLQDFATTPHTLENGIRGEIFTLDSHSPAHWADIISGANGPPVKLAAQLFMPAKVRGPVPAVILVPGSTGVNRAHARHAASLSSHGIAAFIVDSFGGRGISHTYHDQRPMTFAAGTYDVLVAARRLMDEARIRADRIGAMGPSRGGSAVLQAAMQPVAHAVLGGKRELRAVLPMYPSGIFQFLNPKTGGTAIRVSMGDADKWTLLSTVQGYVNAIRLCGGDISLKVWRDAEHSFDRPDVPLTFIEDGLESTRAPIYYLSDQGHFHDLQTGLEDPTLTEHELRITIHDRYGHKGCSLGSKPGQPEMFTEDMLRFFKSTLLE